MKKLLLITFTLFTLQNTFSQEKNGRTFFSSDFNLTFRVNENYTINNDDDETFLIPSETLLRFGFGYEFKKKLAISFNAGFDYHFNYSIASIPTYIGFQYNIWNRDDEAFFIRFDTGKLWRTAERFSDGDYRAYGLGWRLESGSRWKPIIKIMYHQKRIKNFEGGSLDNISIGFGFNFL
jgi:hypothetical protein